MRGFIQIGVEIFYPPSGVSSSPVGAATATAAAPLGCVDWVGGGGPPPSPVGD